MTGAVAYTLSAVVDGRRVFLTPDQQFTLPNVIGCGTFATFELANEEAYRVRKVTRNATVEIVRVIV